MPPDLVECLSGGQSHLCMINIGWELRVRGLLPLVFSTVYPQVGGLWACRIPRAAIRAGAGRVPVLGCLERQHSLPRWEAHLLPACGLCCEFLPLPPFREAWALPLEVWELDVPEFKFSVITSGCGTWQSLTSLRLSFFIFKWDHSTYGVEKRNV